MESDLKDLMTDIKDFCDKYGVNIEVSTWHYTLGNTHKVEINVKKEE